MTTTVEDQTRFALAFGGNRKLCDGLIAAINFVLEEQKKPRWHGQCSADELALLMQTSRAGLLGKLSKDQPNLTGQEAFLFPALESRFNFSLERFLQRDTSVTGLESPMQAEWEEQNIEKPFLQWIQRKALLSLCARGEI